jgi:hypothetical protein
MAETLLVIIDSQVDLNPHQVDADATESRLAYRPAAPNIAQPVRQIDFGRGTDG